MLSWLYAITLESFIVIVLAIITAMDIRVILLVYLKSLYYKYERFGVRHIGLASKLREDTQLCSRYGVRSRNFE